MGGKAPGGSSRPEPPQILSEVLWSEFRVDGVFGVLVLHRGMPLEPMGCA